MRGPSGFSHNGMPPVARLQAECREAAPHTMAFVPSTLLSHRSLERLLVLLAGSLVGATVIAPPGHGASVRALIIAVVAAATVTTALASHSAPAVRAAIVAATVFLIFTAGAWLGVGPAATTVAACVLPLAVLALLGRRPAWRPAMPWLRRGHADQVTWVLGGATVLVAAAALTLFAVLVRPEVSSYLAMLRSVPTWLAVVGVIGFALVNPIWEDILFRGVLQHELEQTIGRWPAVAVQAALFGLVHLYGFPSGWFGVLMAGAWGFGLGVIRLRSGGILMPYIVHFFANVTIGVLAVALLR